MAEIVLENVSYTYPGESAPTLAGLNLTIEHGRAHALLGASGAGKTTMLNLLSGLLHPSSGRILFDGVDVSLLDARARDVALVFQFPVLYESLSVIENLVFPLMNRGWQRTDAVSRAVEISTELGIEGIHDAKPAVLSLFQKQLVAIGKSLMRDDVDLVLLDEPLTAVEPSIKWRLRQTLTRLQQSHGLTMVYVTHDQTEALTFAEEVSVMARGTILQTGKPVDIFQSPNCRFVGHFIGSPGMQFVDCDVADRTARLTGHNSDEVAVALDLPNGHYQLGARVEWVRVRREPGSWQVQGSTILGTEVGEARVLLTLTMGDQKLQAQATGKWSVGDNVNVIFDRFILFDDEKAVVNG
ncbi:MAG: ABC transporter ATP-binding protein [bacterium]|nr:ABC transporter ATP-binding protein [Gammaproteobacteria bacterium]